jgi:hypothetical protein
MVSGGSRTKVLLIRASGKALPVPADDYVMLVAGLKGKSLVIAWLGYQTWDGEHACLRQHLSVGTDVEVNETFTGTTPHLHYEEFEGLM